jgi:hypothetical protein
MYTDPVPRSLIAVDIEGYSRRDNQGHQELRAGLREVCDQAFSKIGVKIRATDRQDHGDAFLMLVQPEVTKPALVDDFVRELGVALRGFNRSRSATARMRLRVALHAGEVHPDGTGFGGEAAIAVMRLIEAEVLREALRRAPGDLAVIVSDQLYRDVVIHAYRAIDPVDYQRVRVSAKGFSANAWIRTPGSAPRGPGDSARPDDTVTVPPGVSARDNVHFGPTAYGGHAAGRDVNVTERPSGRWRDG